MTVTLRPFTEDDTSFFTGLAGNEQVNRFVGDGQPWDHETIAARVRIAFARAPVDMVGAVRWFIALTGHEPVGLLASTRWESGVEIGYWVSPGHCGRGVAGSMVEQALTVVPTVFGCDRIVARVDPANAASARVLTRRGFRRASTHRGLDQYVRDPAAAPR